MAVVTPTYTQSDLTTFTYQDLMRWAQAKASGTGGNLQDYFDVAATYGVGEEQAMLDFLAPRSEGSFGIQAQRMADGTYSGYVFQSPSEVLTPNPLDSNAGTVARTTLREMVGQKFQDVQGTLTRNMTRFPVSGGLGQQASYVLGSVAGAFGAVSTGTWLGKQIDSLLYNANPDFWDSIGLSSLDPATWGSLTNGDDSPFAGLLNFVLGIDPQSGQAQMYMNQDALAYIAYAMALAGVFAPPEETIPSAGGLTLSATYQFPLHVNFTNFVMGKFGSNYRAFATDVAVKACVFKQTNSTYESYTIFASEQPFMVGYTQRSQPIVYSDVNINTSVTSVTYNGKTFYAYGYRTGINSFINVTPDSTSSAQASQNIDSNALAYLMLYGSVGGGGIEGITDQDGATLPDTSTWDTPADTLASLQQQYPGTFANPMVWENYGDDGTPGYTTWVPVPMPTATSAVDTQPTTGDQTQTSVEISQLPQDLIDLITDIVQRTSVETDTQPLTPPQNPVDTGTGEPPVLVPPTGTASALWSVYHPTQAQVNQFGAWLWTDSIIEQFLRLMNNPMEGIISLHRVFVTPVDSGNGTIVVGRLDSGVPTALVTQQYVYLDCGTVDLAEQFANVFDYAPYTGVSLYLPFIGIVGLSTSDVMRGQVNVTYGVDVFTGACLATVTVTRDGNTVGLYQYSGVASVSYPLTGAQNSGLLSGLMGIAAGIGSVATGNVVGGAATIATSAVGAATTHMGRSGGFSGNAGAMGLKVPYLIVERPQTMVASTFPDQEGYPTNYSATLGEYTGFVRCRALHTDGIPATAQELEEIRQALASGVIV